MKGLNRESRALIDAARDGDEPSAADRKRVRAALGRKLAVGAAAGAVAATVAHGAAGGVASGTGAVAGTATATAAAVAGAATVGAGTSIATGALATGLPAKLIVSIAIVGAVGAGTVTYSKHEAARRAAVEATVAGEAKADGNANANANASANGEREGEGGRERERERERLTRTRTATRTRLPERELRPRPRPRPRSQPTPPRRLPPLPRLRPLSPRISPPSSLSSRTRTARSARTTGIARSGCSTNTGGAFRTASSARRAKRRACSRSVSSDAPAKRAISRGGSCARTPGLRWPRAWRGRAKRSPRRFDHGPRAARPLKMHPRAARDASLTKGVRTLSLARPFPTRAHAQGASRCPLAASFAPSPFCCSPCPSSPHAAVASSPSGRPRQAEERDHRGGVRHAAHRARAAGFTRTSAAPAPSRPLPAASGRGPLFAPARPATRPTRIPIPAAPSPATSHAPISPSTTPAPSPRRRPRSAAGMRARPAGGPRGRRSRRTDRSARRAARFRGRRRFASLSPGQLRPFRAPCPWPARREGYHRRCGAPSRRRRRTRAQRGRRRVVGRRRLLLRRRRVDGRRRLLLRRRRVDGRRRLLRRGRVDGRRRLLLRRRRVDGRRRLLRRGRVDGGRQLLRRRRVDGRRRLLRWRCSRCDHLRRRPPAYRRRRALQRRRRLRRLRRRPRRSLRALPWKAAGERSELATPELCCRTASDGTNLCFSQATGSAYGIGISTAKTGG